MVTFWAGDAPIAPVSAFAHVWILDGALKTVNATGGTPGIAAEDVVVLATRPVDDIPPIFGVKAVEGATDAAALTTGVCVAGSGAVAPAKQPPSIKAGAADTSKTGKRLEQ
jgi:hypothetical protein